MSAKDSVCVIPTLVRTEMLALTLEKLAQAPNIEDIDVRIFVDWGITGRLEDTCTVRDAYLPTAEVFQAKPHIKVQSGTWNILESLKAGYETGKEFLFLVEEDILVIPNFFEWHWDAHSRDNYFVTCGRRHGRMPLDFYSNPGTCYRRNSFHKVIPHINDIYFGGPTSYVDKNFPTMIGMDGSLDDGLIRKVQRSVGGKVLCAEPRVCSHVGFHYYDRVPIYKNQGKTIQERIECLRVMLRDVDRNSKYISDLEPC